MDDGRMVQRSALASAARPPCPRASASELLSPAWPPHSWGLSPVSLSRGVAAPCGGGRPESDVMGGGDWGWACVPDRKSHSMLSSLPSPTPHGVAWSLGCS